MGNCQGKDEGAKDTGKVKRAYSEAPKQTGGVAGKGRQALIKDHGLQSEVSIFDVYDGVPHSGGESKQLGSGGTADVYLVTHKESKIKYALKVVKLGRIRDQSKKDMLLREIQLIKMLDHPNTVKVIEVFQRLNYIYIVMELCTGGELFDKLYSQKVMPGEKAPRFTEADSQYLSKKMVASIAYLHHNGIVHRDLKLENFIFTSESDDAEIKLIDFGFSRQYLEKDAKMTNMVGTCYYLAPEVLKKDYTESSDLWSLGVVIYMMVTGAVPFGGSDNEAIIAKVKHDTASGNVSDTNKRLRGVLKKRDLSGDCIDFIMGLLTVDVKKRLTAQQAAKHTWLASEMIDIEGASDANRKASLHNGVTAAEMEETDDTLVTSMKTFKEHDLLKRTALLALSVDRSAEELKGLNKAFADADKNGDGLIDPSEFQAMMAEKGMSSGEIDAAFKAIDQDGAGLIKYSEFIAAAIEEASLQQEDKVEAAFRRLDIDDSGSITISDLKAMLPDGLEEAAVQAVLDAADCTDKDGMITLAEFKKAMGPT